MALYHYLFCGPDGHVESVDFVHCMSDGAASAAATKMLPRQGVHRIEVWHAGRRINHVGDGGQTKSVHPPVGPHLRLQPLNRIQDSVPHLAAGHVAVVKQLVGAAGGLKHGVGAEALHNQPSGAVHVPFALQVHPSRA
jgi:hypothetical protein